MNLSHVLPLLLGLFSLALFFLVVRQGRRSLLDRLFLSFLGAMALWGFAIAGMRLSSDLGQALWWERAALTMIGFTTGSFFLFVRRYTGAKPFFSGSLAVLFLAATVALAPTGLLAKGMSVDRYGNAPEWGLLFPLWMLGNYALVVTAIVRLEQARRAATSYEERNRYLYFVMGAGLSLLGAGSDAVSAAGVPIYPMGIIANIAFSSLTTIAILKYHLLDIRVTLRKGAVYLLTSTLVAAPFVAIPALLVWLLHSLGLSHWWLLAPLPVLALLFDPVWRRAQPWVERSLYGERYDHLRALERFSEQSRGITGMSELCSLMVGLAQKALQPTSASLLVASATGDFVVTASVEMEQATPVRLGASNPLAARLKNDTALVWHRELDIVPQLQAMSLQEREALNSLNAELYSPIITEGQLIAILTLGPRRLRQIYTREDFQLLSTLCRQAALNLENVRLLKLERERAFHLEKLEQMKSDFLLSISHQLKTPLTSVKVSAGILAESKGRVPDELRERLVNEIGHGVAELETQISAILDLAKMQSASLDLDLQPTDVREVIQEVAEMMAPQVRLKQQTLELALADSLPAATVDRERLKQVLANLLSNANKFSPREGHISVHLRQLDASFCVEVRDTGPGIPMEEQEKIFDAYYQVRDKLGRSPSGTGLGLTIAKALVELHGGRIWVESQPGKGATFFFSLPTEVKRTEPPPWA